MTLSFNNTPHTPGLDGVYHVTSRLGFKQKTRGEHQLVLLGAG